MKTTIITSLSLVGVLGAGTAAALVNTSIFDSAPQNEAAAFVPGAELVELTLPEPVVMAAADTTADPMVDAATTPAPATLTTAAPAPVTPSASLAVTATDKQSQDDTPATTAADASDDTTPSDSTAPSDSTPDTTAPATTPATTTPATTTPPPAAPLLLTTYDLGGAGSVTVDVIDGRMTLVDATAAAGWTVTDADIDALTNEVEVELTDGSMIVDFEVVLVNGALVPSIRTEQVTNDGYDEDEDEDHDDEDEDHDDDEDDDDDDEDDDDEDEDDDEDDD
jgi:hypothetical protein